MFLNAFIVHEKLRFTKLKLPPHQIIQIARVPLTISCHHSLSVIASHSLEIEPSVCAELLNLIICCLAIMMWPYVRVRKRTSLVCFLYFPGRTQYVCPFYLNIWLVHWLSGRMFANGPGDRCSISGRAIPKTPKVVLNSPLLNTQHYMVHFKGKVKQNRERK